MKRSNITTQSSQPTHPLHNEPQRPKISSEKAMTLNDDRKDTQSQLQSTIFFKLSQTTTVSSTVEHMQMSQSQELAPVTSSTIRAGS